MKNLIGNEKVKGYLQSMIKKGATWDSLLFSGPSGVGKRLFAYEFTKEAICHNDRKHEAKINSGNHPDIHFYRPEGKIGAHSIDSMRKLSQEVYLNPNEAKRKVFIIYDAERMAPTSANALLKTFEEPPENTLIILVSDYPESIIPTILSRCRKVLFEPISKDKIAQYIQEKFDKSEDEAKELASLARGSLGRACHLIRHGTDPKRTCLLDLLSTTKRMSYGELMGKIDELCSLMEEAKKDWQQEADKLEEGFDDLTSAQKQAMQKEKDGIVALQWNREANVLFDTLAFWYRDIHLLKSGADPSYLVNSDYRTQIESVEKRVPPLDYVQQQIIEAKVSIERSTQLKTCLETLFLKLGFMHVV